MPQKDTSEIKQKIINTLKIRGPSLPVHIAKEINMSILFTSAFLSELIAERRIKTSNMKVGSSKLHFLEGQEPNLEKFAHHLSFKEKEAFELLKQKKFLEDEKQVPAIRVALRAIKDFAIPIDRDKIIWRYYLIPESEYNMEKPVPKPLPKIQEIKKEKELGIFDKTAEEKEKTLEIKKPKKSTRKSSSTQKKNEKFFDKVKEHLSKRNIEILDIVGFSKNDLTLKVNTNQREYLLVAYNKKRIKEEDIIKASKKASELGLRYIILSLGEPLKKLSNLIEAIKDFAGTEKIE